MEDSQHIKQTQADHELLIRIDEKLKTVSSDVKDMKDNTSQRLSLIEGRVEGLEGWRSIQVGALVIISSIVIPMAVYIFKSATNLSANTLDNKIQSALNSALNNYSVTVK